MSTWYDEPTILFTQSNQFIPLPDMQIHEKLNAIVRGAVIIGLVLYVLRKNILFLIVPILFSLVFTYTITPTDPILVAAVLVTVDDTTTNSECRRPTRENPLMNAMFEDNPDTSPACKVNDPEIQQEITEALEADTYRDVADVYNTNNANRQFTTNPSTSGDQREYEDYKKFVYTIGESCKDNSNNCKPYEDIRFNRAKM
jgi:hypothetical protein